MNWLHYLLMFPGLLVAITVHEFAHAWSASLLGDDYARRLGRVSLNPLRHLTPLGTLAIILLPFGWGKPVPVNLYNFKHPRRDYLLSSLAGPVANILLVGIGLGLMLLTRHCFWYGPKMVGVLIWAHVLLMSTVIINGILAALNLVPIPPLDGSKIWPCLLGWKAGSGGKVSRVFLIILVVLMSRGVLTPYFDAVTHRLTAMMPAGDSQLHNAQLKAGQAAAEKDQWNQAEACFSKALGTNPWSQDALVWRASARMHLSKLDAARDDLDEAIRLWPKTPELYQMRAILQGLSGHGNGMQEDAATYQRLTHPAGSQPADTEP